MFKKLYLSALGHGVFGALGGLIGIWIVAWFDDPSPRIYVAAAVGGFTGGLMTGMKRKEK